MAYFYIYQMTLGDFAISLTYPHDRYILDANSVLGRTDLASCVIAY